jgi:site-specific recombinase XerD
MESTIKEYRGTLSAFISWFEKNYAKFNNDNINMIDTDTIYHYLSDLSNPKITKETNGNRTKLKKLTTLNGFFRYLFEKKLIELNPVSKILENDKMEFEPKIPRYFTLDEIKLLLTSVDDGLNTYRDRLIITMFYMTGLRLSELESLNRPLRFNSELVVKGKGGKERTIYIVDMLKDMLNTYLDNTAGFKAGEPLFVSTWNRRLSSSRIKKMIEKCELKAGLTTGVHILRHSYAYQILQDKNADLGMLQDLLGHSDPKTTNVYKHYKKEKITGVVNNSFAGVCLTS